MNKYASVYINSFNKIAGDNETSAIGRYLAMKAMRAQTEGESPWRTAAGNLAGIPLAAIPFAGPLLGSTVSEAGGRYMSEGFEEEERKKTLSESIKGVKDRGYGENAGLLAKKILPLGLTGGGLAGLGYGAMSALSNPALDDTAKALQIAGFGALGAGAGGLLGAGGGAVTGLLSSAILKNTTPKTQELAKDYVAERPIVGSLPFGEVGGAISRTPERAEQMKKDNKKAH